MKMHLMLLAAALATLVSAAVHAESDNGPTGLLLDPVASVSTASGQTTISGYMPLPADGAQKQRNAATYPSAADTIGCAATASKAKSDGRPFEVVGTVSGIYATNGVFTMAFSALSYCKEL